MSARAGRLSSDAVLLFTPFAIAFWFVVASLVSQWLDDPNYTHGLFVLPMAGVLAWRRRHAFSAAPARPSPLGIVVLLAAGALYVAGVAGAELFSMRVSLVVSVWGIALAWQGTERFRVMRFPLLFLLTMIPLPYVIYYKMTFPLQLLSTKMAASVLAALGTPLVRMGNVIHLETYSLEVVTACSGLRSIMTLGTLAIFLLDFLRMAPPARLLFLALVVPVAVIVNTGRLIATAVLSALSGPEAAEGFLHDVSGVAVFLCGLLLLFFIGRLLQWQSGRRG